MFDEDLVRAPPVKLTSGLQSTTFRPREGSARTFVHAIHVQVVLHEVQHVSQNERVVYPRPAPDPNDEWM